MKKAEFIWVIIRLIGVYFIYLTVTNIFSFVTVITTILGTPTLLQKSGFILLQGVILMFIYGILGIYLLKDGSHLFSILDRENPQNNLDRNLKETSLNFDDKRHK